MLESLLRITSYMLPGRIRQSGIPEELKTNIELEQVNQIDK